MWWQFERIIEETNRLRGKVCCLRCKAYYPKRQDRCEACAGLSDAELAAALDQRKTFRTSLGKMMLMAAVVLFVAVVILDRWLA